MIDPKERRQEAENNFLKGYNCCQSVMLAFRDVTGLDEKTTLSVASGFGGGMARMREVCGTVSAMVMIAGFILPAPAPADMEGRKRNYALVQHLAASFRQKTGSVVCREILGLRAGTSESPAPSARTPEYYRTRPCAALVGLAAEIVAQYLSGNLDIKA